MKLRHTNSRQRSRQRSGIRKCEHVIESAVEQRDTTELHALYTDRRTLSAPSTRLTFEVPQIVKFGRLGLGTRGAVRHVHIAEFNVLQHNWTDAAFAS